jgi:hypothetical protein
MTTPAYNPDDSRINVVIRLCGMMFTALGLGLTYETFVESGAETIQPPLIPVLYLCSGMLILVGIVALFARYKPSGGASKQ